MSIVIWLLTFCLVLNCLLLILLVLIQLPKKEAGLGQAFGGAATDALFGAGSGNALTKLTKYAAGVFFALTLSISLLQGHQSRAKNSDPRAKLTAEDKLAARAPAAPAAATNDVAPPGTNIPLNASAVVTNLATNLLSMPPTNLAPAAPDAK
jgi:preprotein translocase subunit SecG